MPDELPLHVRVAEALGWTNLHRIPIEGVEEHDHWTGEPPEGWSGPLPSMVTQIDPKERVVVHMATIPRFHDDWAVTRPLIERYGINIDLRRNDNWWASCFGVPPGLPHLVDPQDAPTPLGAVCLLILKLAEAGALKDPHAHPDPVRR